MWQKFLYSVFFLVISSMFSQTYAQTVGVEALCDISTANPTTSIDLKLVEPLDVTDELQLTEGVTLKGDLVDVVSPKRLKRDASFSFKLKSYTDTEGNSHDIGSDIIASYTVPVDKGNIAKNAALGVGNYFVKGLSVGAAAIEGAVKNPEDNRLKSSVVSVYEASPLSYIGKGDDLEIGKNQIFYLKFPNLAKSKNSKSKKENINDQNNTLEKE